MAKHSIDSYIILLYHYRVNSHDPSLPETDNRAGSSEHPLASEGARDAPWAVNRLIQARVIESADLVRVALDRREENALEEAVFWAREALRVSRLPDVLPQHFFQRHYDLATILMESGYFEEAVELLKQAYELADNIPLKRIHSLSAAVALCDVLEQLGRSEEANRWRQHIEVIFKAPTSGER